MLEILSSSRKIVIGLFDGDGFGQVAGLVYVAAAADGDVVGEQLQGDDFDQGGSNSIAGGMWMTCSTSCPMVVSPSVAMAITRPERAVTSWMLERVFS